MPDAKASDRLWHYSVKRRNALQAICLSLCAGTCREARANDAQRTRDGASEQLNANVIRVGPNEKLKTIAHAQRIARDGDVVELEPAVYVNDVATWTQNNITIRGTGVGARLLAEGTSAENKAIWVIKGTNIKIERIEFSGARVADENGAGIRHEGGSLLIRNCVFENNQMGLLTHDNAKAELEIEASEFRNNSVSKTHHYGARIGHQIYVGRISRFVLRECYIHDGAFGHLVKSRAKQNYVCYNFIGDTNRGRSSYELEFPDGSIAYVIGNVVQQGRLTENRTLISFGAEGYRGSRQELYLINNTLIDDHGYGIFLNVRKGADAIWVLNNLLLGDGSIPAYSSRLIANHKVALSDLPLAYKGDFRLARHSALVGKAVEPGIINGIELRPRREYVHPLQSRVVSHAVLNPGALQTLAD